MGNSISPVPVNTPIVDSQLISPIWANWLRQFVLGIRASAIQSNYFDSSGNFYPFTTLGHWRFRNGIDMAGNIDCMIKEYYNGSTWIEKESQSP